MHPRSCKTLSQRFPESLIIATAERLNAVESAKIVDISEIPVPKKSPYHFSRALPVPVMLLAILETQRIVFYHESEIVKRNYASHSKFQGLPAGQENIDTGSSILGVWIHYHYDPCGFFHAIDQLSQ